MFDLVPSAGESLEEIREDLGDCRRCKLSSSRKNMVFGSGNPHAELMFVGGLENMQQSSTPKQKLMKRKTPRKLSEIIGCLLRSNAEPKCQFDK